MPTANITVMISVIQREEYVLKENDAIQIFEAMDSKQDTWFISQHGCAELVQPVLLFKNILLLMFIAVALDEK